MSRRSRVAVVAALWVAWVLFLIAAQPESMVHAASVGFVLGLLSAAFVQASWPFERLGDPQ